MRRLLILILTIILIVLAYFIVTNGLDIGNFRISSWNELIENNNELDKKIESLDKLSSITYPQEQSRLNDSYKQLKIKKDEYADLVLYSTEEEIKASTQTEIYETEFLWTKIGNYATKNNKIDMKIDVVKGSSGQKDQYNLNFTLIGEYAYISDFISSIENDTKLGFRINKFLLVPGGTQTSSNTSTNNESDNNNEQNQPTSTSGSHLLKATFTVENVGIKINNETKNNNTNEMSIDGNTTNENSKNNTVKESTNNG